MRKILGYILFISSIIVVLTFRLHETVLMKLVMLFIGLDGMYGGLKLIKQDSKIKDKNYK